MHRRQFLSSAVLLPAVASGRPAQPVPRPAAGGLKLGLVTYNIAKDWDIPTLIARLGETGFEAVELRTTHKHTFPLLRDRIGQVHMRDLFDDYPWRALLSGLAAMRFQGYCFAEIPGSPDPMRVLRYFRALFRAYQGL